MMMPTDSPQSSTDSFHTAASTSLMPEDVRSKVSECNRYRPAKQLPNELKTQCGIYLNEKLYCAGLALLNNLLTTGSPRRNTPGSPAFVPTPVLIEFTSTLLVHPFNTTNSLPENNPEVASTAITLLRSLLSTVGPVNGNLKEALSFTSKINVRTRLRRNGLNGDSTSSDSEDDERASMGQNILVHKESIRERADDFWHAVGWAFNCSVKYPNRWKYWKIWLEYMLDVIDADWKERERQDQTAFKIEKDDDPQAEYELTMLQGSMIVGYLSEAQQSSAGVRRVVKAAFADGGDDMLKAYPAVFENEARDKKRKHDQAVGKPEYRCAILEDEEDSSDASNIEEDPLEPKEGIDEAELERASLLGGLDAVHLRQRVLGLLSLVAARLPDCFVAAGKVYDFFVDYVKVLPLPAFSLLISPSMQQCFLPEALVSLYQLLLGSLMQNSTYRSRTKNDGVSQELMEERYLPAYANTSSSGDNTKVSILVESLFRLFIVCNCLVDYRTRLVEAVEKGIRAREGNIKSDKRKKGLAARRHVEDSDRLYLQASAERLRSLLVWVEAQSVSHKPKH